MFKLFLSLTFAVGFASAATISTSVTCDGVTTVGTFSASCNSIGSFANADVTAPSFVDMFSGLFQLGVAATAIGDGPNESSSASANFSEDYVFTVSGGTGNGSFFPCFSGSGNSSASQSFAGVSFGFTDAPAGVTNCFGNQPSGTPKPFTFGVSQIVSVGMQGSAASGFFMFGEFGAFESFDQILFFRRIWKPTLECDLHARGGSRTCRVVVAV